MKIAFFLPNGIYGGGERILLTLMDAFSLRGYDIVICTYNRDIKREHVKYPIFYFEGNKIKQIFFITKFFLKEKVDVFISFGNLTQYFIASKLSKVKFVHSLRIDLSECNFNDYKIRYMWKHCDLHVFQTNKIKSQLEESIQNKSIVIYNPIMDDLPEVNLNKSKNIALIGRLSEEKNQKMAIEAFKMVDRKGYKLHIFGQGHLEKDLKQLVESYELHGEVVFEGQVTSIINKINGYDILLLTSDKEGMPNALIEGMAMGLACITTNFPSGAATELIEDGKNGYIVPVKDAKQMAKKLQILINSDEIRRQMQIEALKIRTKLDKNKIINEWLNAIKQLN